LNYEGIASTLDDFAIFEDQEDPNENIPEVINSGLNYNITPADDEDFYVEGDLITELLGQFIDEYVHNIWEAVAVEVT